MIVDAHLHCTGRETAAEVLAALDEAEVDVAVLLAPFLTPPYALANRESLRSANAYLARLVSAAPDRLVGLAVVNPALADAHVDAREALDGLGLTGLKMVPSGWYPDDARAHAVYRVAAECKAPILFHSGIFIDGRSGRFCRPAGYEPIRDHPGLRVTLAHLGWPWTDEANAVGIIDLINGVDADDAVFRFDISFGPPPVYRREALRKALACVGAPLLQFGSDRFLPCPGPHIASAIAEVREHLSALDASAADVERIMSGTALAWLEGSRTRLPAAAARTGS